MDHADTSEQALDREAARGRPNAAPDAEPVPSVDQDLERLLIAVHEPAHL